MSLRPSPRSWHQLGAMRLILVALVLLAGLSLWVYVIAWALLPDGRTGTIPLERWIS